MTEKEYRGRIAPSPTGFLHLGHAMTFWRAHERARAAGGKLILRIEDLDRDRCRKEFTEAIGEDLRWFGLDWDEGPDVGGGFAPYVQSQRCHYYMEAWEKLHSSGFIYPCQCSRKDVARASLAPHETYLSLGEQPQGTVVSNCQSGSDPPSIRPATTKPPQEIAGTHENLASETIYPGTCRPLYAAVAAVVSAAELESLPPRTAAATARERQSHHSGQRQNAHWRFQVPDGERIEFVDQRLGKQSAVAGRDFGDFIVWRRDDVPAYQLAVVVDDAAMQISEVVRGEDLLISTFRQLLLYRALKLQPPKFHHAPLLLDESGKRLAKRHGALSLRALRQRGISPEELHGRMTKACLTASARALSVRR